MSDQFFFVDRTNIYIYIYIYILPPFSPEWSGEMSVGSFSPHSNMKSQHLFSLDFKIRFFHYMNTRYKVPIFQKT
jgi:hypothetical protein